MELNEMKTLWEKTNKLAERNKLAEEKIIEMLKKSYKGVMNSLLGFELLMLISMPLCIGLLYYTLYFPMAFSPLGDSQAIKMLTWTLIGVCVVGFFWDWYKYNFLRKINIATMNIIKVSEKMLTYRKYIINELIIGMVFLPICLLVFIYLVYNQIYGNRIILPLIIFYASVFILAIVATLLIYKFMYFNNIKKIQDSLKEIEEFKKEMEE